ncbi:radical SAM/SPASM domain-containing protein [Rhizohabitans arisaemae]|uniref:radical SAM/SPASM domain-containing protein n=1 Tax=Rhizohabitans arisaemae TaxID=2720610 RepID=UPI0024B223B0|nr:radical SAM protein [Rhizohabitans arisaemae]
MTVLTEPATGLLAGWYLAAELTGRCQLSCSHCYASSGPLVGHGAMTGDDWCRLIDEAAALAIHEVQFIGGEPTRHPEFERILTHAIDKVQVEVFTNLYRIKESLWERLARPGVSLATSFYSNQQSEHARITGRHDGYGRTRANIIRAVGLGISIRAAIVDMLPGQHIEEARTELSALGVTRIRVDRLRGIGRAATLTAAPDPSQLCGRCGDKRLAVSPSGDVTPCVLSRWMITGNVLAQPLAAIVGGQAWYEALTRIPPVTGVCDPECNPASDGADCAPAQQVDGQ